MPSRTTGEKARKQRQKAVRAEKERLRASLGREPTEDELQDYREQLAAQVDLSGIPVEWEACPEALGDGWRALAVSLVLAPGHWRTERAAMAQASMLADSLRRRTEGSTLLWRPDARLVPGAPEVAPWEGLARSRAATLETYPSESSAQTAAERLADELSLVHHERRQVWPRIH